MFLVDGLAKRLLARDVHGERLLKLKLEQFAGRDANGLAFLESGRRRADGRALAGISGDGADGRAGRGRLGGFGE